MRFFLRAEIGNKSERRLLITIRPVKIVGSHSGVSVGPDGGTHQALEDIALMRVLPNMDVVSPCDAIEAKKATLALQKQESRHIFVWFAKKLRLSPPKKLLLI